jgi:TatA/E family protein of Tat protein translocase
MIGTQEIILILAILLIVFGPKKLPELAKELGKAIQEFRKASSSITDTATSALKELDSVTPIEKIENTIDIDLKENSTNSLFKETQRKTVKSEERADIKNDR